MTARAARLTMALAQPVLRVRTNICLGGAWARYSELMPRAGAEWAQDITGVARMPGGSELANDCRACVQQPVM